MKHIINTYNNISFQRMKHICTQFMGSDARVRRHFPIAVDWDSLAARGKNDGRRFAATTTPVLLLYSVPIHFLHLITPLPSSCRPLLFPTLASQPTPPPSQPPLPRLSLFPSVFPHLPPSSAHRRFFSLPLPPLLSSFPSSPQPLIRTLDRWKMDRSKVGR